MSIEDKAFWADVPVMDKPVVYLDDVLEVINDYESRVCQSCEHHKTNFINRKAMNVCHNLNSFMFDKATPNGFGCPSFERE